eukprot:scaffold37927_cov208-Isochrysis_galbana.AAC.1
MRQRRSDARGPSTFLAAGAGSAWPRRPIAPSSHGRAPSGFASGDAPSPVATNERGAKVLGEHAAEARGRSPGALPPSSSRFGPDDETSSWQAPLFHSRAEHSRSTVGGAAAYDNWQLARPGVQGAQGASGRRSAEVSAGIGRACRSGSASHVGGRKFGWSGTASDGAAALRLRLAISVTDAGEGDGSGGARRPFPLPQM